MIQLPNTQTTFKAIPSPVALSNRTASIDIPGYLNSVPCPVSTRQLLCAPQFARLSLEHIMAELLRLHTADCITYTLGQGWSVADKRTAAAVQRYSDDRPRW